MDAITLRFEVMKKVLHVASNDRYGAVFTTGPDGPESQFTQSKSNFITEFSFLFATFASPSQTIDKKLGEN